MNDKSKNSEAILHAIGAVSDDKIAKFNPATQKRRVRAVPQRVLFSAKQRSYGGLLSAMSAPARESASQPVLRAAHYAFFPYTKSNNAPMRGEYAATETFA